MKSIVFAAGLFAMLFSFAGCKNNPKEIVGMNPQFDAYKTNFVEEFWKVFPEWASRVGYHKYDSILVIPDEASRQKESAFARANMDSLSHYDLHKLSDNNVTDYYLIKHQLQYMDWTNNIQKSFEWNPAEYNVCRSFADMLNNNYDSLDVRLHNFYLRMAYIPAYYEAAKMHIKNPTLEHTQLAIEQNIGGIPVFEEDLIAALGKSSLSGEERKRIEERANESVKAIRGYANWLKYFKNDHPRSFRLGKDLYAKKFEYEIQSSYTPDQIYEKALKHKKELHKEMAKLANKLWPKYFGNQAKPSNKLHLISEVCDKISLHHVSPDSFQTAIEQQIPVFIDFIKKKDLLYIDPSKPLVIREEPAYMAGVAGASVTPPGPYDKNGVTYFNVPSLAGWDKEKAESYLRENNYYILQIVNMHESYPGHYTQLVYSNKSRSIIKSLFGTSTTVEGWAIYAEQMMLENGYGNNEPEMWLMYDKWNLRTTCNVLLDYSVHTGNMSREEAMNLLMNEAFQQKAEAENKWKRVTLTSVQLCCYFTGYTDIYDFREEMKKKMGSKFNLRQFHEKFLSYGNAPVKYIKPLMLDELEKQKK